jgi:hypothetical protein
VTVRFGKVAHSEQRREAAEAAEVRRNQIYIRGGGEWGLRGRCRNIE